MEFFGLDIGSYSLKLAQVEKDGKKNYLKAFGAAQSPSRGLMSEAESDLTQLSEAIKKLYQASGISTKNVAVALPEDKAFSKVVSFPRLTDKELQTAIKWEAEQFIPVPLEEVSLDYQLMGSRKEGVKEKMEVFLVAAPKRLIEKIMRILSAVGLTPVALETEILSLARSLVLPDGETSLLIDLGARATDMAIVEGGQVVFTRSIGIAGEALTRAVATRLNLDPNQAEEYKKAYGADPAKLEGRISTAIGPILETIIKEVEKSIQFYFSTRQKQISRVILAGGTAGLPEVVNLLAKKLNMEIQVGDPQVRLAPSPNKEISLPRETAPAFATAIGLALKSI